MVIERQLYFVETELSPLILGCVGKGYAMSIVRLDPLEDRCITIRVLPDSYTLSIGAARWRLNGS